MHVHVQGMKKNIPQLSVVTQSVSHIQRIHPGVELNT